MTERPWLIVGLSVRPLAVAAAAHGHPVCAIDPFLDTETLVACAGRAARLPLTRGWRMSAAGLAKAIGQVRERHAPSGFAGIVAGSGFEAEPALLDELGRWGPLCGNDGTAITAVREPQRWFRLLDRIGAPYPAVSFTPPHLRRGWLMKSALGAGGRQVKPWTGERCGGAACYFQRRAAGRPASLLFAADGQQAAALGWQWQILAPTPELPWRYGGVISATDLPEPLRCRVTHLAGGIVAEAGLRGLCGLDFLVDGEQVQLLELNPRPTASVTLYPQLDLFAMHRDACAGQLPKATALPLQATGEAVVYASTALAADADHPWSVWCRDVPATAARFAPGEPVCSVRATAATPAAVRAALARHMANLMNTFSKENPDDEFQRRERERACRSPRPLAAR